MQENNPVPMQEVATPVVVEQPKQSNFLVTLLSVLLLFSISIAGFFAYQTQKLVKELTLLKSEQKIIDTPEPIIKPLPTMASEIDPTTNWKTYTNTKLKFSFRYPSNLLTIIQNPDQNTEEIFFTDSIEEKIKVENCIKQIECYSYPSRIYVNSTTKDANLSFEDYLIKIGYSQGNDMQKVFIDNKESLKINFTGIGSGSNVFVPINNQKIIQISTNSIQEEQKNLKILDQILSTFRFLE